VFSYPLLNALTYKFITTQEDVTNLYCPTCKYETAYDNGFGDNPQGIIMRASAISKIFMGIVNRWVSIDDHLITPNTSMQFLT